MYKIPRICAARHKRSYGACIVISLLLGSALQAATISEFSIEISPDSPAPALFNDGAQLFGMFSLDVSQATGSWMPLESWDVWTTDGQSVPGQHYFSGAANSAAFAGKIYPLSDSFDLDQVLFFQGQSALFLSLLEPSGTFGQGYILVAEETYWPDVEPYWDSPSRSGFNGFAALVNSGGSGATTAPEPSSGILLLTGALLVIGPKRESLISGFRCELLNRHPCYRKNSCRSPRTTRSKGATIRAR
jgi:hypothetical protein